MRELVYLTASELASRIQTGIVTASEALEAQLAHLHLHNPALNALVTVDEEGARARAREADEATRAGVNWGPLHGVPVTIKDSFLTRGLRTTSGWSRLSNNIPDADAEIVSRLRAAGAIILAKSNVPELSEGAQTTNRLFGRTNNPWDHDRTPGGSSGGGAAAVAAGLSRLDVGSDVSGSIRMPAHFCGIYGLKPTGGRVPINGHIASVHSLALPEELLWMLLLPCPGPLARSVDDLELCLRVMSDSVPAALVRHDRPESDVLRIAWTDSLPGMPVTSESRSAVERIAEMLADAGHTVRRFDAPGFDFTQAWELAGEVLGYLNTQFKPPAVRFARKMASHAASTALRGGGLRAGLMRGPSASRRRLRELADRRELLIQQIDAFLAEWDTWICPVYPSAAFPHCDRRAVLDIDGQRIGQDLAEVAFNVVFNVSGHPSVVLPTGATESGLPIGMQMIGHRWGDENLLEAATRVDSAVSGYVRPPGHRDK